MQRKKVFPPPSADDLKWLLPQKTSVTVSPVITLFCKDFSMALSIGIVGLPNVGKSTLFNALTKAQNAEAANYPFCTIEPNKATVPVPDSRVDRLAELVKPQKTIYATVDFIDIAGLVRGASKGEGLGNQFLANIRECAAIVEVVRCFDDENITHVDGSVDPLRDVETIETELLLADMESLGKKLERLQKQVKGDKDLAKAVEECAKLLAHLDGGKPASSFPLPEHNEPFRQVWHELSLLTAKKIIYCANVDEAGLTEDNSHVQALKRLTDSRKAAMVKICARIEEELQGLSEADQKEMLASYGIEESGLENVIRTGYRALGLASYFTAGPKEVRAWTFQQGWKAPQAAGVIHTDFEKGFIRAEVISFDDYVTHKSEAACRGTGTLRVEGKDYVVRDGDVMHFLFNV
jgi:GTP-binding protein YchF